MTVLNASHLFVLSRCFFCQFGKVPYAFFGDDSDEHYYTYYCTMLLVLTVLPLRACDNKLMDDDIFYCFTLLPCKDCYTTTYTS